MKTPRKNSPPTLSKSPTSKASTGLSDDIVRALRKILRKVNEHSRQLSREGDLSVSSLLCLRYLASVNSATITSVDIAKAVQLTTPTVSRILDRVEKDGLISRSRSSDDRRKVFVRLTTLGKRRVAKLPQPLQEGFLERLGALPKKQQRDISTTLQTVVELLDADDLDAAPILSPEVVGKPGKQR